jgi:hypothetical protein
MGGTNNNFHFLGIMRGLFREWWEVGQADLWEQKSVQKPAL